MKTKPILEDEFYHDGRGPELQKVIWKNRGISLVGFEYYNPDDIYSIENIKHLKLEQVEVYSMVSEELHCDTVAIGNSRAAILEVDNSHWLRKFNSELLEGCSHYKVMFYDQIYDVICRQIISGRGKYHTKKINPNVV